jgi:hypothetical protein
MKKYNPLSINKGVKKLTYYREPTAWEIKFGYGAIHYKEFSVERSLNAFGHIKKKIKCTEDGLIYMYSN